jgi:S1-C subfamily serine protease
MTPAQVYRQVADSVFVVLASHSLQSMQEGEGSQGSAVAVAPDLLLTNCHVLTGRFIIAVQKGDAFMAEAVAGDPATDRCVLRAGDRRNLRPATVRASSDLEVGDKLFTVGSPNGLERTLGEGLVSGLRLRDGVPLVQTTAQISPGSSGGGLFDQQGNLVGITSFLLKDAQTLNFAIGVEAFWTHQ